MVAGGASLAAMSNNVLKVEDHSGAIYSGECVIYFDPSFECTSMNKGALWVGIGMAGVGAWMAAVGRARQNSSVSFVPMSGGGAVFRRIVF